jgi:hypothetical protein
MLLLALHVGGAGVALGLGLAYFAIATQNVPHDTLLNEAIPNERRSILLSINSLVFFLGIAVGSGDPGVPGQPQRSPHRAGHGCRVHARHLPRLRGRGDRRAPQRRAMTAAAAATATGPGEAP